MGKRRMRGDQWEAMEMLYDHIPRERIAVLVGPGGKTKKAIEKKSGVVLIIDSETGEVVIEAEKSKDPVMGLRAASVVRAIARGFSPERAFRLFEEETYLTILDIHDFIGKSKKRLRQVKARIIGSRGKTRKTIEEVSGADISIYGDTVAIIGDMLETEIARTAVVMIIEGSEHSTVYGYLHKRKEELRIANMGFEYYERKDTYEQRDTGKNTEEYTREGQVENREEKNGEEKR